MNKRAVESVIMYVTIMTLGMVAIKVVVRVVDGPDFSKLMQMRAYLGIKNFAQEQAEWWTDVGLKAATKYNKCRL